MIQLTNSFDLAVQSFLAGRIWLRDHIPFHSKVIDAHIATGSIKIIPGIKKGKSFFYNTAFQCNRCENSSQSRFTIFSCAKCEGPCVYCRHCLKMGRVSSCSTLITWNGPEPVFPKNHLLAWEGILTPLQQLASDELFESTIRKRPHLIHAVCGAGKTEILFEPIYKLLREGKRVCIAAPRVDVILELEPRLRAAF